MRSETILVLGASGFLGAHVARLAAEQAGSILVCACRAPESGPPLPQDSLPKVCDARDEKELLRLLDEVRPRSILNTAGLTRMGDCDADPASAERLNAGVPEALAHYCAATGARLVHVSTDLVFGAKPPRHDRYDEDDPASPLSNYGRTKAAGEQAVLATDSTALVVRLPLLYGASDGRGLGASGGLLRQVEAGERPRLFVDEWRTPLEVGAAARAVVELAATDAYGLLHVAGPDRVTRMELGQAVLRAAGLSEERIASALRPARRADLGLAETRPRDTSLDASRAVEILRVLRGGMPGHQHDEVLPGLTAGLRAPLA